MLKTIMVADDFGWSSSANEAILHAHRQGALDAASLMMGQLGTKEALSLAKETPTLEIGLHFHLCDSKPLTTTEWPWGDDPSSLGWKLGFQEGSGELVRDELHAQWNAFEETGLKASFVNVHHHLHSHPWIFYEIQKLLKENGFHGWFRLGTPRFFDSNYRWKSTLLLPYTYLARQQTRFTSPETLWGIDRPFCMKSNEVRKAIGSLTEGIHEFIFHPRQLKDCDTQCLIELENSTD